MKRKKKIALVLSGGGALGCAHIGVIKVLEKYNVPIDIIVGTSMGGVVGAGYSVGLSVDEMTDFATKFKTTDFIDMNFNISGVFSGKGVMKIINKFLPDINIEDLNKKFACVSSDLLTATEYVFTTGSVREAVRATLSLPGVFVPVEKDNKLLVDGGVLNNLPENVAINMGADIVISCDVLANFNLSKAPKNAIESLLWGVNITVKELQRLKGYQGDVILKPDMHGLGQVVFTKKKVELAIRRGEQEAERMIKDILKLIKE